LSVGCGHLVPFTFRTRWTADEMGPGGRGRRSARKIGREMVVAGLLLYNGGLVPKILAKIH